MNDAVIESNSSPVIRVVPEETLQHSEEGSVVNPLLRLHVMLCGRYRYAIMLALLLGICGSLAAWILTPAKYEIVGYVRIKPYIPKVLYQSDENGILPSFETFVDLQESLLQSQRVMDRASQNPDWKAIGRPSPTPGENSVMVDNLVVDHPKGSELITVTATDRDVNAAMAAVKSILQAYLDISTETDGEGDAHRLQVLEDLRVTLANQSRAIHDKILAIANEYGTDDLSQRYGMKVQEANNLDTQLQQINLDLTMAEASAPQASAPDPLGGANVPTLTREDVAAVDERMRNFLAQEDAVSLKLIQLRSKYGEENEDVKAANNELGYLESRIGALLVTYQARGNGTTTIADRSKASPAELSAQQKNVRALYEKVQADALDLGRKDLQLRSLKQDEAAIKQRLDEASNRIDQLNLEANSAERISILSYGERPTTPPKSKRIPLTAAAGLGGIVAGIGLVALWGLLEQKARSVLQVQQLQPAVRMLGVLPVLPDELSDPEQKSLAAHCVHQIRNLLDVGDGKRGRVFAVTSPAAGDGKTSLTLGLGLSFAAAGSRTLLIDCDMVGGGLTGRLNAIARRGFGSILRQEGLITDEQLKEAQQIATATGRKLSEVLVERRFVTEANVKRAIETERESSIGLLNALDGENVAACVTPILANNLSILPLGEAAVQHTSQMSAIAFRRIINEARALFDVVIVDTGPILGSLEAAIVVREVDEVVVAVARAGRVPHIKRAIALLDSLGVRFAGLVFNRATSRDVAFAYYGSWANSASIRSSGAARSRVKQGGDSPERRHPRLGSLAAAVVGSSDKRPEKEGRDVSSGG